MDDSNCSTKSFSGSECQFITNYTLRDDQDDIEFLSGVIHEFTYLITVEDRAKYYLSGDVLSAQSSDLPTSRINTEIVDFSVNFGSSLNDINRGLWLKSVDNIFYKLQPQPHSTRDIDYITRLLNTSTVPGTVYHTSHDCIPKTLRNVTIFDEEHKVVNLFELSNQSVLTLTGTVHTHSTFTSYDSRHNNSEMNITITLPCTIYIHNYTYDLGYKLPSGENTKGFYVQDVYSQWYRMDAYSTQYQPMSDIMLEQISHEMLTLYNFPDTNISRRVSNYSVRDMLMNENQFFSKVRVNKDVCILSGTLIPTPIVCSSTSKKFAYGGVASSATSTSTTTAAIDTVSQPLRVTIYLSEYKIYNGCKIHDTDAGIWFLDSEGAWYKPTLPCHIEYTQQSIDMLNMYSEYKKITDAMFFLDLCGIKTKVRDEDVPMYCTDTIRQLHDMCDGMFDLEFIQEHKKFVTANLAEKICPRLSSKFYNSIQLLGTVQEEVGMMRNKREKDVQSVERKQSTVLKSIRQGSLSVSSVDSSNKATNKHTNDDKKSDSGASSRATEQSTVNNSDNALTIKIPQSSVEADSNTHVISSTALVAVNKSSPVTSVTTTTSTHSQHSNNNTNTTHRRIVHIGSISDSDSSDESDVETEAFNDKSQQLSVSSHKQDATTPVTAVASAKSTKPPAFNVTYNALSTVATAKGASPRLNVVNIQRKLKPTTMSPTQVDGSTVTQTMTSTVLTTLPEQPQLLQTKVTSVQQSAIQSSAVQSSYAELSVKSTEQLVPQSVISATTNSDATSFETTNTSMTSDDLSEEDTIAHAMSKLSNKRQRMELKEKETIRQEMLMDANKDNQDLSDEDTVWQAAHKISRSRSSDLLPTAGPVAITTSSIPRRSAPLSASTTTAVSEAVQSQASEISQPVKPLQAINVSNVMNDRATKTGDENSDEHKIKKMKVTPTAVVNPPPVVVATSSPRNTTIKSKNMNALLKTANVATIASKANSTAVDKQHIQEKQSEMSVPEQKKIGKKPLLAMSEDDVVNDVMIETSSTIAETANNIAPERRRIADDVNKVRHTTMPMPANFPTAKISSTDASRRPMTLSMPSTSIPLLQRQDSAASTSSNTSTTGDRAESIPSTASHSYTGGNASYGRHDVRIEDHDKKDLAFVLCRYCRDTTRHAKCDNRGHKDGCNIPILRVALRDDDTEVDQHTNVWISKNRDPRYAPRYERYKHDPRRTMPLEAASDEREVFPSRDAKMNKTSSSSFVEVHHAHVDRLNPSKVRFQLENELESTPSTLLKPAISAREAGNAGTHNEKSCESTSRTSNEDTSSKTAAQLEYEFRLQRREESNQAVVSRLEVVHMKSLSLPATTINTLSERVHIFCPFCKSLLQKTACRNVRHFDGKSIEIHKLDLRPGNIVVDSKTQSVSAVVESIPSKFHTETKGSNTRKRERSPSPLMPSVSVDADADADAARVTAQDNAIASSSAPNVYTVIILCRFCRHVKKARKCPSNAHIDGCGVSILSSLRDSKDILWSNDGDKVSNSTKTDEKIGHFNAKDVNHTCESRSHYDTIIDRRDDERNSFNTARQVPIANRFNHVHILCRECHSLQKYPGCRFGLHAHGCAVEIHNKSLLRSDIISEPVRYESPVRQRHSFSEHSRSTSPVMINSGNKAMYAGREDGEVMNSSQEMAYEHNDYCHSADLKDSFQQSSSRGATGALSDNEIIAQHNRMRANSFGSVNDR